MPSENEPPQPSDIIFWGSNGSSLWDNIPGVIYRLKLNPDGTLSFPYISCGCQEMFGITPAMVMANANSLLSMIHPEDIRAFQKAVAASAHTLAAVPYRGRAVLANGDVKWIESAARPQQQANSSVIWDGVLLDITEQQRVAEHSRANDITLQQIDKQLELANQELQQATRLRDEFLASMNHELRTPLNVILGLSEGLQAMVFGELNDLQLKSIGTIERSGKHLLALINDILDVSKLATGQLELEITSVSATQLAKSCLLLIAPKAQQKGIQVRGDLPAETLQIQVDERRLRQVLISLLSNAVKFTPTGGQVILSLKQVENSIHFAVTDTGIGIAEQDRSKLFQPFVQIDSSLNRKYEGTGLGLTLVKQLIDLHEGSIQVQSEVNQGSCFTVCLPPACLSSSTPIVNELDTLDTAEPICHSLTVLLAGANAANTQTVTSYLRAKSYQVCLALNGAEAIALSHRHQPNVILLDIARSNLDLLGTITHLQQQPNLSHMSIVALVDTQDDGDLAQAAGAQDYLVKPLRLKQLDLTIRKWATAPS